MFRFLERLKNWAFSYNTITDGDADFKRFDMKKNSSDFLPDECSVFSTTGYASDGTFLN